MWCFVRLFLVFVCTGTTATALPPSRFDNIFQNLRAATDRAQAQHALAVLDPDYGEIPEKTRFLLSLSPIHYLVLERHQLIPLFALDVAASHAFWDAFRLPALGTIPVPTHEKWITAVNARLTVELEALSRDTHLEEMPRGVEEQVLWYQEAYKVHEHVRAHLLYLSSNQIPLHAENAALLESIVERVLKNVNYAVASESEPGLSSHFGMFLNHGLLICNAVLSVAQWSRYDTPTTASAFHTRWERLLTDYLVSTPSTIEKIRRGVRASIKRMEGRENRRLRSILKRAADMLPELLPVAFTIGKNVEQWLGREPAPTTQSSATAIKRFVTAARNVDSVEIPDDFAFSPPAYGDAGRRDWSQYEARIGGPLPRLHDVELEFLKFWSLFSRFEEGANRIVISVPKRVNFQTTTNLDENGAPLDEPRHYSEREFYMLLMFGQLWLGPGYWLSHTNEAGQTLIHYLNVDEPIPSLLMRPGRVRMYSHIRSWTTPLEGDTWLDELFDTQAWESLQHAVREKHPNNEPITARQLADVLRDKMGLSADFFHYMFQGTREENVYANCVSSILQFASREDASTLRRTIYRH